MTTDNNFIKVNKKDTVNPYLDSFALVLRRLAWDLKLVSWSSRRKLTNNNNKYKGQKAVIVCNGPSLLKSDLSLLQSKNVFTFGLNKINLIFDKSDFRPSCIVTVNPFVIEQNQSFLNQTNIPLFFDSCALKWIIPKENNIFFHSSNQLKFAKNCSISLCQSGTVTFVAMQLAFHMGFQDVALIGCDHNFSTKGPANAIVIASEADCNHFDSTYFSGGVKWNLPDLARSEVGYMLANDAYTSAGRKLLNATEGGYLEVLPRISLEQFVLS
jgi:hypothetical protein